MSILFAGNSSTMSARDPWLILLHFGARNRRHETTFYAALGVKVGIAADQCGVGFELVLDIGSQRADGDM